jgi:hypothetical protein
VGSVPGFSIGTTPAYYHAEGKYCLPRTALNTSVRKVIACFGRCLWILFGIPFGPGALPTLSTLMACRNVGSLAGAYSYAHIASPTISVVAGSGRVVHRLELSFKAAGQGFRFSESETACPPGTCKGGDGVGTRITCYVNFHTDWSSLSKDSSASLH